MRKLIVGLLVALVVSAGAYFGAVHWAERTAAREVDARLDRWRSGGGTATRGRVAFDLWTRTVRVADVALQSPASPPASPDAWIAIKEVVASGIDPHGGASRLDLVGLQTSHVLPGLAGSRVEQKAARVTLTGFSERPVARAGGASPVDAMRPLSIAKSWLEQLSAITASSIEAPSLTVTIVPAESGSRADRIGTAEYTYSNILLRGVADGRIAEATVDKIALRGGAGPMSPGFTGEVANASVRDIDMGPILAWLDPSRPREEDYRRVYGQLSIGPYSVRLDDGTGMGIDRIVAEEIGLRPARLPLDDLVFLMEVAKPGTAPPTAGQLSMLVDKMAGLYAGLRFGRLELQGLRMDTAREAITIGSIALDGLDNGRLAGLSIERVDGRKTAKEIAGIGGTTIKKLDGPTITRDVVSVGRVSLKGFDIAKLLRTASAQLASLGLRTGAPSPLMAMLGAVEGVEIRDFTVPHPATGRAVQVEALDASWGQLVGGIPSEGRLSARLSGPVDPTDPDAFIRALAGSGMGTLAVGLDLGARWTEAQESVVLAPATLEIPHVLALSIKASAGKVTREMLSTDILKAMAGAPLVEAGPVELTIRDLGLVDLAAAQLGQAKGGDAEMGRALLVESLVQKAAAAAQTAPELQPVLDALTRFVRGKGETLTVALTPKGSVGLLHLIEGARRDAVGALLANFAVEARTGG